MKDISLVLPHVNLKETMWVDLIVFGLVRSDFNNVVKNNFYRFDIPSYWRLY